MKHKMNMLKMNILYYYETTEVCQRTRVPLGPWQRFQRAVLFHQTHYLDSPVRSNVSERSGNLIVNVLGEVIEKTRFLTLGLNFGPWGPRERCWEKALDHQCSVALDCAHIGVKKIIVGQMILEIQEYAPRG